MKLQAGMPGGRAGVSPALVVSIVALVVASTGTGLAASGVLIHSSRQIGPHVIKGSNIASNTIDAKNLTAKVRSALAKHGGTTNSAASSNEAALGAGPNAREAFRKDGPDGESANQTATVATMSGLAPGIYAIFAKTILTYTGPPESVLSLVTQNPPSTGAGHCTLNAAGDSDYSSASIRTFYGNSPGELHMQITRTLATPGDIVVSCTADDPWRASDTSIIAVQLGSAPKEAVSG